MKRALDVLCSVAAGTLGFALAIVLSVFVLVNEHVIPDIRIVPISTLRAP